MYVLVVIVAKERAIARKPSEILQILGIILFGKVPMNKALAEQDGNDFGHNNRK